MLKRKNIDFFRVTTILLGKFYYIFDHLLFLGLMLCLADNTIISFVIDAQIFLWHHARTHTQSYSSYVKKVLLSKLILLVLLL